LKIELGRLYVFEGPDGVGKTTISRLLARYLQDHGRNCLEVSFPGRNLGTLGALVNAVHHHSPWVALAGISPAALQALHVAAHIDTIEREILPALRSGADVVLDRFWWSTIAYGLANRVSHRLLKQLVDAEKLVWGRVRPTRVFLLQRILSNDVPEQSTGGDLLATEYLKLAKAEGATVVKNDGSLEDALEELVADLVSKRTSLRDGNGESADIYVCARLAPAKPTRVFDTYWRFAAERQDTFFRRLSGSAPPWTSDPIILSHRFTNAYRASDRVSQFLIRKVQYTSKKALSPEDIVFRTLIFKVFNRIETWELIDRELGEVRWSNYRFEAYDEVLAKALSRGERVYSAAYIMPPGGRSFGHVSKHRNHLALIEHMMSEGFVGKLVGCRRMQDVFALLKSFPTIGNFLAYQFATDLNYSELVDFSEMEFVMPGPGALDGLRKCFEHPGGLTEPELIRFMADIQESEFERLGLTFKTLWGRRLQLIDCQNLFCEVDKYARVAHPDISGISGRSRIKQKYRPSSRELSVWYPPKWGINDRVPAMQAQELMGGLFEVVEDVALGFGASDSARD
jgi:thymidylate kinase